MDNIFKYLPIILFSSLFGKIIYRGNPTGWESLILVGAGIISFAHQYYNNNSRINKVNSELAALKLLFIEHKDESDKKITATVSSISSIKMGHNMTTRKLV